jgi:hypothetical protein
MINSVYNIEVNTIFLTKHSVFSATFELNLYLKCRQRFVVKGLIYYVGTERDVNLNTFWSGKHRGISMYGLSYKLLVTIHLSDNEAQWHLVMHVTGLRVTAGLKPIDKNSIPRGVSGKWKYITCRSIGKFFMLFVATLPLTLILYLWAALAWQW